MRAAVILVVLAAMACAPSRDGDGSGGGGNGNGNGSADAGQPGADARPPAESTFVYAHSATELYKIDPDTLQVSLVGAFQFSSGVDQMTDIAIDKGGRMIGVSFGSVYACDSDTAVCSYLADLDRSFNGLSFVPAQEVDPTGDEILVGAALDGTFWQLDPNTGVSTQIGSYGGGRTSSGDIVSVAGFGTVATIKQGGLGGDWLVRVDPATGVATDIGDTGASDIWGLGFWENKVFGFTEANLFVLVDVTTGVATTVETGDVSWWGAGVTTSAPVIE